MLNVAGGNPVTSLTIHFQMLRLRLMSTILDCCSVSNNQARGLISCSTCKPSPPARRSQSRA